MTDVDSTCKQCKFFDDGWPIGVCHRYPSFVHRHANEWCGEFLPTIIPVVKVETVVKSNISTLDETLAKPKRRGRPAKGTNNA